MEERTVDGSLISGEMRQYRAGRLLLIELDGADYSVLVPLAEAGVMPNLAGLLQTSALLRLEPHAPWCDAVAWTTLRTGCGPAGHGILDDQIFDHRRRRLLPAALQPLACSTVEDLVSGENPAAPAVRVGQTGPSRAIWDRKPASLEELEAGIRRLDVLLRHCLADVEQADATSDWRLLTVRIDAVDALQHWLWNLLGIGDGPGGCRTWVERAQQAFAAVDRCLGELLDLAARRGASVMLVSPTGFVPFRERISAAELLRRNELLHPAGFAGRMFRHVSRGIAGFGDGLERLVRRSAAERSGIRPLAGSLPLDWRTSRAVSLHGTAAAMIYLNTRERFGSRVLKTRRQHDQAATDILSLFEDALHPATSERLFQQAYLTAERFDCDPLERRWPEVVAIPAAGFHNWPLLLPQPQLLRTEPTLTATHSSTGLWMIRAPGIELGQAYRARLVDVAPSILELLDLPAVDGMTGRGLGEIFAPVREVRVPEPASAA
jgi:predicted AlkP superfamily phosphohydrolase/phosphomutase